MVTVTEGEGLGEGESERDTEMEGETLGQGDTVGEKDMEGVKLKEKLSRMDALTLREGWGERDRETLKLRVAEAELREGGILGVTDTVPEKLASLRVGETEIERLGEEETERDLVVKEEALWEGDTLGLPVALKGVLLGVV